MCAARVLACMCACVGVCVGAGVVAYVCVSRLVWVRGLARACVCAGECE